MHKSSKFVSFMESNEGILFAAVTERTGVLTSLAMPISSSTKSKTDIYKQKPETVLTKNSLKILYNIDTVGVSDSDII